MHITFSIDGEDVVSPDQRRAFSAVLRAVADTLASGTAIPVVEGFRPSEPDIKPVAGEGAPLGPSGSLGARTPLVTAGESDPYLEKPKKEKPKKDKPAEPKVADSKDPAQTSIPGTEPIKSGSTTGISVTPSTATALVPDADALRAIVNKYTNRFGLAKLRETVTAFGVKKLIELSDAQKIEWAQKRNEELAAPAVEEN